MKAAGNGDLAMLGWLKRQGRPYDRGALCSKVVAALTGINRPVNGKAVFRWFHDNGFPGDWLAERNGVPVMNFDSD